MRPTNWSFLPAITPQSLSVSFPQRSRAEPVNCFHLPSIWSQFIFSPINGLSQTESPRPPRSSATPATSMRAAPIAALPAAAIRAARGEHARWLRENLIRTRIACLRVSWPTLPAARLPPFEFQGFTDRTCPQSRHLVLWRSELCMQKGNFCPCGRFPASHRPIAALGEAWPGSCTANYLNVSEGERSNGKKHFGAGNLPGSDRK